MTLPLEPRAAPGPAPGLRAEGLCQGYRGELRSCRRNIIINTIIYKKYIMKDTTNYYKLIEFSIKILRYTKDIGLKEVRV